MKLDGPQVVRMGGMYLVRNGVVSLLGMVLVRKQVLRMGRQCDINMKHRNIDSEHGCLMTLVAFFVNLVLLMF